MLPVDWHGYQISYRPGKHIMVRRALEAPRTVSRYERVPEGERLPGGRQTRKVELSIPYSEWVTINDVGSFFQCSFVRALEEWLGHWDDGSQEYVIDDPHTRAVVDKIAEGKLKRNEFRPERLHT
jgi:hypothetical protein